MPFSSRGTFTVGADALCIAPYAGNLRFFANKQVGAAKMPPLHEDLFLIGYFITFTVSLT